MHEEEGNWPKTCHREHVQSLKDKLREYALDPFGVGPSREIYPGNEFDPLIVNGILNAGDLGNSMCEEFVEKRQVAETIGFFHQIKKVMLHTVMQKKMKTNIPVSVLKEDRKVFHVLLGKERCRPE